MAQALMTLRSFVTSVSTGIMKTGVDIHVNTPPSFYLGPCARHRVQSRLQSSFCRSQLHRAIVESSCPVGQTVIHTITIQQDIQAKYLCRFNFLSMRKCVHALFIARTKSVFVPPCAYVTFFGLRRMIRTLSTVRIVELREMNV